MRFLRGAMGLFAACATMALAGCQPPPGEVAGTIKISGKAPNVKGLQIAFLAPSGQPFVAPIGADGAYTAMGVAPGEAKVYFVYMLDAGEVKQGRPPLTKPVKDGSPPRGSGNFDANNPIPIPLRDASTSNLTVNVVSGQPSVFDYDIKLERYQP